MRQDTTIRKLQVIGQAVKNLSDTPKSQHPQIPWKQIAGLRDKVIHDYFGVNLDIVWAVLEKDLPSLRTVIDHLLTSADLE
jgi:uncharacterized protein with HEPN domain